MGKLHTAILCLGTNFEQEENMRQAQSLLRACYPSIVFTPSLWTSPIGVATDPYLNCMARLTTEDSMGLLLERTKAMEGNMHSSPQERSNHLIRIDIDILKYDVFPFHRDDWKREYVKQLFRMLQDTE